MSCKACENEQENPDGLCFFFRVGNGNVMVIACKDHAEELQELLRFATIIKAM